MRIQNEKLSEDLLIHIANQFDLIKDKQTLTYEKDFNGFALGYILGVVSSIKTRKEG